jgi:hypothetical protein
MQADAYWVCAGAANVFLVFLFRYNAEQLRRLYPLCWVICYGIPAIPATFSLIYRQNGKHMYGDATVGSRPYLQRYPANLPTALVLVL